MNFLLSLILTVLAFSEVALADDCFSNRRLRNWNAIDDRTVIVESGRSEYQLDLGFCSEIRWSHRIAFRSFYGDRVCRGDRLLVLDNWGNYVKQECYIYRIEKL